MRILAMIFFLYLAACPVGPNGAVAGHGGEAGDSRDAGDVSRDAGVVELEPDAGTAGDGGALCVPVCGAGAACEVGPSGPRCGCASGYSSDGGSCSDIDECQAGTATCPAQADCRNSVGSYFCVCGPGQLWNGAGCEQAAARQVGAGSEHVCRIDEHGEMWCWGQNRYGQLGDGTTHRRSVMTRVSGAHVWKSVAVLRDTTCGIDTDRRAWCWGLVGALVVGASFQATPQQQGALAGWVQLSVGEAHVCGLRQGGGLFCWGSNPQAELGMPTPLFVSADAPHQVEPGTQWGQVSAGPGYTCAVKQDGSLWCWGRNLYGNLGEGTLTSQTTPTRVGTDSDWRSVDTGAFFTTCGIRLDGKVWCWGQNSYAQVGGAELKVVLPNKRSDVTGWRSVESGSHTTCGVQSDGTLSCWGRPIGTDDALLGQGRGGLPGRVKDVAVAEPGAVGRGFALFGCAVTEDNTTWCWGQNNDGELAQGTFGNKTEPVRVGQATWSQAEPGAGYSCGVRTDGTLWCWGANGLLFFNVGQPALTQSPVKVAQTADFRAVSVGAQAFCARKSDASAWCAGFSFSDVLTQESGRATWSALDMGRGNYVTSYWLLAAGVRTDGSLWAFNDARPPLATQFGSSSDWQEVAISRQHACGRRGGAVWCWLQSDPTGSLRQIGAATDWQQIRSAPEYRTLSVTIPPVSYGIRAGGSLWRWVMKSGNAMTPTQIGAGLEWQTFDVGPFSMCGVTTDKSLWCWGDVDLAASVTGEIKAVPNPVRVGTDNDWATVNMGAAHVTALKIDGSLWSWGFGENGQLGHGDSWRLLPTQAR